MGAEKGLSYYYSRKEYAESIKRLKELQETLKKKSEIVRDNTFTGVITLVRDKKWKAPSLNGNLITPSLIRLKEHNIRRIKSLVSTIIQEEDMISGYQERNH